MDQSFDIFLACAPGLEPYLAQEAQELGFASVRQRRGGVEIKGGWPEVWRANLELRGAVRVLARIGGFRAMHLAQLDKRSRKFGWDAFLRADVPLRVEATSTASRIYHGGDAAQRVAARHDEGANEFICLKLKVWCGGSRVADLTRDAVVTVPAIGSIGRTGAAGKYFLAFAVFGVGPFATEAGWAD